jgi:large subunit ribosomal protein L25
MQTLRAEPRTAAGKGGAFRTRSAGSIPGVVYGGKGEPRMLQVDAHEFGLLYNGGKLSSTLFMLELDGEKTRVIPRDIQLDPVTDRPIHVDFLRLAEGARISLNIPVHFRGQESSPGLKRGGVINIVRHTVELYCPADNIPAFIEGDLSTLDIGDSLHISAFNLPEGVRPVIQNRNFTVATIAPPTTYVEEVVTTAAATTTEGAPAEGAAATPGAAPAAAAGAAPEKGKAAEKK